MSAAAEAVVAVVGKEDATRSVNVQTLILRLEAGDAQLLRDLFAQAGDNPVELWQIVRLSLCLEETVATGCLLVQAIALVRLWTLYKRVPTVTPDQEPELIQWLCQSWCEPMADSAADESTATNITSSKEQSRAGRSIRWRASFAVQLHSLFDTPDFPRLQHAILGVCISTLRLLQQRFWLTNHIELFIDVLLLVKRAGWGKHVLNNALRGWSLEDTAAAAAAGASSIALRGSADGSQHSSKEEQRRHVLMLFADRVKQYLHSKATKKLVRDQHEMLSEAERAQLVAPVSVANHLELLTQDSLDRVKEDDSEHLRAPPTAKVSSEFAAASPTAATAAAAAVATPVLPVHAAASLPDIFIAEQDRRPYWERQVDLLPVDVANIKHKHSQVSRTSMRLAHLPTYETNVDVAPPSLPKHARGIKRKSALSSSCAAAPVKRAYTSHSRARSSSSSSPRPSPPAAIVKKGGSKVDAESAVDKKPVVNGAAASRDDCRNEQDIEEDTDNNIDGDDDDDDGDRDGVAAGGEQSPLPLLEFAEPLIEAAPFQSEISARLRTDDAVVLQPCFREHVAWLRELNVELLHPSAFTHGYRMSLGCMSDGSGEYVAQPSVPAASASQVDPSHVWDFLEAQWLHMTQAEPGAAAPTPPVGTTDRIYFKDLSQLHDVRRTRTFQHNHHHHHPGVNITFFPNWDRVLEQYDAACDEQVATLAAAALCATHDGDVGTSMSGDDGDLATLYARQRFPALFLDAYARHPKSLLRLAPGFCDGMSNAYAYLKHGFQMFNAHVEQCLLPFVHQQLSGQSVWILVARRDHDKLLAVANEMALVRCHHRGSMRGNKSNDMAALVSPALFYSKSLFPPLSLLRKYGISYRRVVLEAGQMLLAHGGCVHYGFSTRAGETYSLACNMLDEHWLVSGGPEFVLQFLEWVLDLAELPEDTLPRQLAAYSVSESQLRAALNTCPPAYTCSLLKAIRGDLHSHLNQHASSSRVPYTLSPEDCRLALANLNDALALLHQPSIRRLYQRFYVDKANSYNRVCECEEEQPVHSTGPVDTLVLRRLHACMERESRLVIGSGQDDNNNNNNNKQSQPLARTRRIGTASAAAADSPSPPISLSFGSVTASPLARLLDFLTSSSAITRASLRLQGHSHFLDVGSGIGQVVLHVQLRCAIASCVGIEAIPDRCDAADTMLAQLQLQRQGSEQANPRYIVAGLAAQSMLDERLDRVRFVRGRIEEHLDLLTHATHVFMFDCCFHPSTHRVLLPRLCAGPPRIVVSCLARCRMRNCWPTAISMEEVHRHFRLLRKMPLTLAGSKSTRNVFVYQTSGSGANVGRCNY